MSRAKKKNIGRGRDIVSMSEFFVLHYNAIRFREKTTLQQKTLQTTLGEKVKIQVSNVFNVSSK